MGLADINSYHKLQPVSVSPEQLFLDPNNPRLIVDIEDDIDYSSDKLISSGVQNDVLDKIKSSEFKVDDLVKSIKEKGYIKGAAPLIVKEIGNSNKYLVLEGNRRTAAIKSILDAPQNVDQECLKTLNKIEANRFTYTENEKYSEEQIINIILGQIHVSGALGWGAMERAHYIYRSYMMELFDKNLNKSFVLNKDAIKRISDIYSFNQAEITKNLKIYRIYEQVKESGYQILPDKFSLIDIAVTQSVLSIDYFGMNSRYQFSDVGVDKFVTLIEPKNGPIKNPKLFRQFAFIVQHGSEEDIRNVENSNIKVSDVYSDVSKKKKGNLLYDRLTQISNDIKKIDISELGDLKPESKEFQEAKKIVGIVLNKIYPLIGGRKSKMNGTQSGSLPNDIDELMQVNSKKLRGIIREALKNRPNKTCVADPETLCSFTLQYLEIVTRGTKREKFLAGAKAEVLKMIKDGVIELYKTGKRERYRLIG